jgi:hypothetical protein
MKKVFSILAAVLLAIVLVGGVAVGFLHTLGAKAASSCMATNFYRDSINLTAAVIPTPSSPNVTTPVNASGCNIGVYYGPGIVGKVSTQVYGANYFGVVNNGSNVTVINSQIHDIGENPLNGDQHGYGIYFTEDTGATGVIQGNTVWNYQKNGIVVRGIGSKATITHNTVIGQGPVNYIAENGIEVGEGAKATITKNIVVGNAYTGTSNATGAGILIYGGSCYSAPLTIGVQVQHNTIVGNDIGVSLSNVDGNTCIPTDTPTNILVKQNIVTNDGINNVGGYTLSNQCCGYQSGVSDQGDNDRIVSNSICGLGYTPAQTPPPYLSFIDVTVTNNPIVNNNTSCLDGSPVTSPLIQWKTPFPARKHSTASI